MTVEGAKLTSATNPTLGLRWTPIASMREFLGTSPTLPAAEVLDCWATACKVLFETRQPQLKGQVWDDIWESVPFGGNLLWVVSAKPATQVGLIAIPQAAQLTQEEGWVLSVGWGVCEREPHSGRCSPFESPLDLVGQRIFWSRFAGVDLGVNAYGAPMLDETGEPVPERNRPKFYGNRSQYSQLRVGDVFGFSLKTGGSIL